LCKKEQNKFTLVKLYCLRCGKEFKTAVEKGRENSALKYDTLFCSEECAKK